MAYKQRLIGSQYKVIPLTAESPVHVVTVTFKDGEELPPGTLFATARRMGSIGSGSGDEFDLTVTDLTGSGSPTVVEAIIDPSDFLGDGERSVWFVDIGTNDPGTGLFGTDWVMFVGLVVFKTELDDLRTRVVIQSTTIEEEAS